MKRKFIIIIVLVVLFLLFIFIRFFFMEKQNSKGKIKIVSSPAAAVFINDEPVGKTPYEDANIQVGEYRIKLIPEGKDKNTVPWQDKIQVQKNTLTYVSRELGTSELTSAGEVLTVVPMETNSNGNTGEVYVETEPTGAIVYLDNDEKGIASIVLQDVPVGDHELAVYLPGFFRKAQKIQVEKGYQVRAKFKLALDQSHKTLEEELEEKRKQASEEAKKLKEQQEATKEAEPTKAATATGDTIEVLDTPTGFLNVRAEPSTDGDIVTKVNPGDTFEYTDTQNGWYKITTDDGEGWVSGDYVEEK